MHLAFLVDGYNLLFALGLHDRRAGRTALEQARARLLECLRQTLSGDAPAITVVFDSARAGVPHIQQCQDITVRFAGPGELADDVIEQLIAEATAPNQLVVISNDHRIRDAARRRGATTWTSADFLDHGAGGARREPPPKPAEPERPLPTRDEVRHWVAEFEDVEHDPAFRELFEPYPFEDEDED